MDFATIVSAVSAVGFPVVFCFILYKTMIDQSKEHKAESDKMTEAIHNNTLVIQQLVDKLNADGKDIK
jgi:hypothetical protein